MNLRSTISAGLAALLLASDLVLLTLFLNAEATLGRDGGALATALFLPWTLLAFPGLLALVVLSAAVPGWPRAARPPLEALPGLTTAALAAVSVAAAVYWLNLVSYRYSVPVEVLSPLAGSAVALTASALVLLAVGIDAVLFPSRGRGISAALVVLAAAAAVVVPLAVRPVPLARPAPVPFATETVRPLRRVVLVGIDGLGIEQLRAGVARGSLPTLAQMVRRGAHGALATLRPTEAPPIWTSIFTGRLPRDHGVKSFSTYRLRGSETVYELLPKGALVGLLERAGRVTTAPVTSASRRRRALWNALNAFDISAGVVRAWATHPPERIQAFMLSPYFHLFRHDSQRAGDALHPRELAPEVGARAVDPADVDPALLASFVDLSGDLEGDDVPWRRELVERALAPDLTYERGGAVLRGVYDPPFFTTYFRGLDVVGHTFMRYARPEAFGNVRSEERRRYGSVVDAYATFLDRAVGELARSQRPGELLLVVSAYGMEPLPHWRRAWEALTGDRWLSGTHADAQDGVLLAMGDGIRPGATMRSASVLDLAPTILYLMGLPVARDMEGRILTEMLQDELMRTHPVSFIPSYESLAVTPTTGEAPPGLPPLPDERP
ncbi:MAG TPA: alkaline phosphatase family protein [Vicinamibacteria bacterium]|nr:alkaline phosphatase family protein [Vicinamibacteria bacterium]